FGPRGTGKSTWLKMTYPDAMMIDLLSSRLFLSYSSDPERLVDVIVGNPDKKTFVIDEIQRVPELLPLVHKLIEADKSIQFILTGSSARKLKRTGVDLLAGRAILRRCHPFIAAEIGNQFKLDSALEYGLIPLVFSSSRSDDVLSSYIDLYIREEIQSEGIIRNISGFSRFLEAISFSHASILNISEVARECQVERKTVEGYIKILEDLMISYRLPVFSKRAKRVLVSHSKFYFFDSGVFRTLRPRGPLDKTSEISGQSLEGLILQHLRAWNEYSSSSHELFYWRTKSGREVDFIVYGEDEFAAIEVKNSRSIHSKDLRHLLAFKEDYPESSLILLYMGEETIKKKDVLCLPCKDFLLNLVPGKSLM
ncbi:ATP-binding protein, partial [bacterium]|nr:ATP-binding protein [bacterium]